jgi:hypothetical protein
MPLVTIESWEKETRTSKKGKKYDCTVFYGTKHGYEDAPDEPWEKPMVPWADGEWIKEIQAYGVGAKILIRNEKINGNWKIVSIEPWGDTEPLPEKEEESFPTPPEGGGIPVIHTAPVSNDSEYLRCMSMAVSLVKGMMDNADTFKSLIKKSANLEFVKQMTIDMANEMYEHSKGADKDEVKSDDSGLKKGKGMKDVEVPMD